MMLQVMLGVILCLILDIVGIGAFSPLWWGILLTYTTASTLIPFLKKSSKINTNNP